MILGAGNTYSPGDQGGNDIVSNYPSTASSTDGSHSGTTFRSWYLFGGSGHMRNNIPYGNHSHNPSNMTYKPDVRTIRMIKATQDLSELPSLAYVLSTGSLGGLANVTSFNDKYMRATTGALGPISASLTVDMSEAGNHYHSDDFSRGFPGAGGEESYDFLVTGAHSNTAYSLTASSVTDNLKKVLLSLWTHNSAQFETAPGMIAMWESVTPPDGWYLCDGNNSTPDLRDSFIRPVTTGSENTTPTGDNTLDFPQFTINQNATHTHQGTRFDRSDTGGYNHTSQAWSHSHTLNAVADISWLPPYYALSFIMKAA